MLQQFIARATEVGARVHGPMSRGEAPELVADLFRSCQARAALVAPDLEGLAGPIAEALNRVGAKLMGDPSPQLAAQADLGVSLAALAIAETGSVVVAGNDLSSRLPTMLPLVHIVLVEQGRMVASLDEAGAFLRGLTLGERGEPVRYVSFVTGPSRTADVEKTLSTGVHGPRELHIILIR